MQVKAQMYISASVNDIFEAFADPVKIAKFWFDGGSSARWAAGETIQLISKTYNASIPIKVIEAEGNHIKYTWGESAGAREVDITIESHGDKSLVVVVERGFVDGDIYNMLRNKGGWVNMLTCLKAYLEDGITTLHSALVED
ncbi:MAG: SRPBCC domain-containing protein [Alphaproteobacteria bacterium]|nr:SRPBCC domain-containing protein [Alphaproteobacteria bacterium]